MNFGMNGSDSIEKGIIFSGMAESVQGKKDLILRTFPNYTGYIKDNLNDFVNVSRDSFYRFKVVSGPYTKNSHNYYYAIPLRGLGDNESRDLNLVEPSTAILIQRVAEFLIGLGWNREKKRNYRLSKEQMNWDWFNKNFVSRDFK